MQERLFNSQRTGAKTGEISQETSFSEMTGPDWVVRVFTKMTSCRSCLAGNLSCLPVLVVKQSHRATPAEETKRPPWLARENGPTPAYGGWLKQR